MYKRQQEYGYFYDGMLPVTRERALELDAAGLTVYVLHEDNTESMVFDPQEIMDHGGLFGVDREEWEKSPQFHEKVMERQEHQQEREQAFLSQNRDCFAIYQVSRDDPQNVRFMNLDWLKSHDISIDRSNYDLIYTAPLRESGTVPEQLEKLYEQFNLDVYKRQGYDMDIIPSDLATYGSEAKKLLQDLQSRNERRCV